MKETRFFLDSEYPLPSKFNIGRHSIEKYYTFFDFSNEKIMLEATPDYLYGKNTAKYIKECIPNAKIIFLLRDRISRFKSWFLYAKQLGDLKATISFAEYYEMQEKEDFFSYKKPHIQALIHGKYSFYIKNYLEHFNANDILIINLNSLKK